mmetsp:Transcript_34418/g.71006  ORF Transcript_34418/g.71006 Transcript_34418/m.71006 type:complete len:136 (+) Transcript_34418:24-431(+)|eukprot:CAMPEP_0181293304 /NCGR_PEP_ID=MMETSP1101-20121128/2993_1 /TAXON_ID=46948 /ORGANISM="Rhodomonas abbreviata, Strain Caron Lab Isolate" /LENGTH=135 /DNA_ID=CAMNT_0023397881 /DNA_START=24 /DNA_END=431 /DNA_ORIENTATION=-
MAEVTIRTKKVMKNPLLKRRQMAIDVLHPGTVQISKAELRTKLAAMLKHKDENAIILFNFRTKFGGNKTTGLALVYDSVDAAKKYDKGYRLWRQGVIEQKETKGRKGIKEAKNRSKKVYGTGRAGAKQKAKRSAE